MLAEQISNVTRNIRPGSKIESPPSPRHNHLLAALPVDDYERLSPHLELTKMSSNQVLCEFGDELRYAYFPTTAVISILSITESGAPTGIAIIGNEGVVGVTIFMGGGAMLTRGIVQSAGYAYRLPASQLRQEFSRNGSLTNLLLLYTQALIVQTAQTAVCNRHHTVSQQFCRWLLLNLDRLPGNELAMTQESLSSMLGVRREGITEAAGKLQRAGVIDYKRGHIRVLDRGGLEDLACECYQVVRREFERLLTNGKQIPISVARVPQAKVNTARVGAWA